MLKLHTLRSHTHLILLSGFQCNGIVVDKCFSPNIKIHKLHTQK